MWEPIHSQQLVSEEDLFAQGSVAGEFAFIAQDGRTASDIAGESKVEAQARRIMVYLPGYAGAAEVAKVLENVFVNDAGNLPAITLVGIAGLEGGCQVRMDAIATTSRDRDSFRHNDLPLAQGALCHGVRVGNFVFLSGVDAMDGYGNSVVPLNIQAQTTETLGRIRKMLSFQRLSLGDLCRTFMFMPGTQIQCVSVKKIRPPRAHRETYG